MGPFICLVSSCVAFRVDSIYPGLNYGGSQEPPLLALRLILVVRWAAQYIVYGESIF